jgi:hypothetical protein
MSVTKKEAWLSFVGSRGLFEECWKLACDRGLPDNMEDVQEMLDGFASGLVNDESSEFYKTG